KSDRVVQSFADEIHAIVIRKNPHIDVRMASAEIAEALDKPTGRKRSDRTNGQGLAHATVLESVQDLVDSTEGIGDRRQQRLAFFGQGKSARNAPEQFHAQTVFQNPHLLTYGRLRHTKLEAGLGEAQ